MLEPAECLVGASSLFTDGTSGFSCGKAPVARTVFSWSHHFPKAPSPDDTEGEGYLCGFGEDLSTSRLNSGWHNSSLLHRGGQQARTYAHKGKMLILVNKALALHLASLMTSLPSFKLSFLEGCKVMFGKYMVMHFCIRGGRPYILTIAWEPFLSPS